LVRGILKNKGLGGIKIILIKHSSKRAFTNGDENPFSKKGLTNK
jgi:hypothetical protein